jgi:hypothetical protein
MSKIVIDIDKISQGYSLIYEIYSCKNYYILNVTNDKNQKETITINDLENLKKLIIYSSNLIRHMDISIELSNNFILVKERFNMFNFKHGLNDILDIYNSIDTDKKKSIYFTQRYFKNVPLTLQQEAFSHLNLN